MRVMTNWNVEQGVLRTLVRMQDEPSISADTCAASMPKLTLRRPDGGASCTLTLQSESVMEQAVYHTISVVSNAKLCELSVQRTGDAAPSYVSTTRGQLTADGQWFCTVIDLQAVSGWQLLELKFLSLQHGGRDACTVSDLVLSSQASDGQHQEHSGTPDQLLPAAVPADAAMSQMDELRLLNQSVQLLGEGAPAVPESLQLLYSKALQQPAGGAAAIKSLSAMIAQGMLQQHGAQRRQQQQQQGTAQAVQQPESPAAPPAPAQYYFSKHSLVNPASGTSCSDSTAGDGSSHGHQTVLHAIHHVEAKLEALASKLLGAIEHLVNQQQHICSRLEALEQWCRPTHDRDTEGILNAGCVSSQQPAAAAGVQWPHTHDGCRSADV